MWWDVETWWWRDQWWCLYVCAVLAACHAESYTYPLDLIKTRLQVQGSHEDETGAGAKKNFFKTAIEIVKHEGLWALWKGIGAVWFRHLIYAGLRVVIYDQMRILFHKWNGDEDFEEYTPMWQMLVCGITCGFVGQLIANPADLIKVQLQMEGKRKLMGLPPRVSGFCDAARKIYAEGGVLGFWRGWIPSCQRAILVAIGDVTTYDAVKTLFKQHANISDRFFLHFIASFIAGFVTTVLSCPADVVKTRYMNQPVDEHGKNLIYTGVCDCYRRIIREEGFLALYKGFWPIWMRMAPWAVINWVTYDGFRVLLGAKTF
ncbi:unnamed protein product [Phyllotreta striolata]|uniref:Mitochondrial uncoupling protein 4 n=1 Tax=Phyllotreta striolata TaxID=444603 RepID=A0A9N9TPF6_PHYSR|nr:unnamed protein product [Phyllotreta striolata]